MQDELTLNFLTIFLLISFFTTLFIKKISHKIGNGILLDREFDKPQAFHKEAIARSGGLACMISLIIFFIFYKLIFNEFLISYFFISVSFFLLGFLDDIKININPKIRLILMISILLFGVFYFSIEINRIDLNFIQNLLQNKLFVSLFVSLCFLFIINGANLIDGFNGLLCIHLIIINIILLAINIEGEHEKFSIFIIAQIISLACFLLFNFPKANIFFGDSGSYLFGSLVAFNVINTNNLNGEVSSFFYCIILFYLFFEVFFSFFRKLSLKKSPLKPDSKHLHMLLYYYLKNVRKFKDSNYLNSILINLLYTLLTFPSFYFKNNGAVCKYWFFSLLVIYLIFYFKINKKIMKTLAV